MHEKLSKNTFVRKIFKSSDNGAHFSPTCENEARRTTPSCKESHNCDNESELRETLTTLGLLVFVWWVGE